MASTRITMPNPTLSEIACDLSDPANTKLGPVTIAELVTAAKGNPHVLLREGRVWGRWDVTTLYFTVLAERGLV